MAILKRKIGGTWVEVTRNFPTQIPVEITQTDAQIATGSFTAPGSSSYTCWCGFVPDIVIVQGPDPYTENGDQISNPLVFSWYNSQLTDAVSLAYMGEYYSYFKYYSAYCRQTEDGFRFSSAFEIELNGDYEYVDDKTYTYVAVKFT